MDTDLVVTLTPYGTPDRPRYSLNVREDGVVWSFDCSHLHATPEAARKCARSLAARWREWEGAERHPVPDYVTGLVEMRREYVTPQGGRGMTVTRMLPATDAVVEVVGAL